MRNHCFTAPRQTAVWFAFSRGRRPKCSRAYRPLLYELLEERQALSAMPSSGLGAASSHQNLTNPDATRPVVVLPIPSTGPVNSLISPLQFASATTLSPLTAVELASESNGVPNVPQLPATAASESFGTSLFNSLIPPALITYSNSVGRNVPSGVESGDFGGTPPSQGPNAHPEFQKQGNIGSPGQNGGKSAQPGPGHRGTEVRIRTRPIRMRTTPKTRTCPRTPNQSSLKSPSRCVSPDYSRSHTNPKRKRGPRNHLPSLALRTWYDTARNQCSGTMNNPG